MPTGPVRWLLIASLALNLLVAGLLLGSLIFDDGPGRGPRPVELALGPFARALDEEDRHAILESLRDRPDLRPMRGEEREAAFADILAAVRAEPFDPARAGAALAAQSSRVEAVQAAVQAELLERLRAMTPEQRAAFAERLDSELRRGPSGKGPRD